MRVNASLRLALTATAAASALIVAAPELAMAQDGQTATASVDDVVVTGSRIRRQDLVSSSPVTTVTSEDLKIASAGTVEEYLNTLPQLVAGSTKGTNVTGESDATASLNLRGLGPQRTLVLVNGRRFMASNQKGIVDVNNIPASLVERVELVTGGASAVYGSDAMAGVVNFILRDRFDGTLIESRYGISGEGDGQTWSVAGTVGASTDNAGAWLHVNYETRETVRASSRELTRYGLTDTGSGFIRTGTLSRLGGTMIGIPTASGGGFVNTNYALDNGVPRPFNAATDTNFDLTGDYAIQIPLDRTNMFGRGFYDFDNGVRAFAEVSFNHIESAAVLSRTAVNARETTNVPGVPYNASFVTPQMAALLAQRPDPTAPFALRLASPMDFPEREIAYSRDMYRILTGLEGKLGDNWDWAASYSYSHLSTTEVQRGDISRRTFVEASTPSITDPTRCASGNPQCVLITSLDTWSPELIDFLRVDNISSTNITEKIAAAQITGDLFTLPAGVVGFAAGAEYRSVESADNPAPVLLDFASAGFGERNATRGEYDVSEVYAEAIVPLLSNVGFAEYVGLELAARYSDYSSAGQVWTYKAGGEAKLNSDWRLRALYQRAARAPNIYELFGGLVNTYPAMIDPCSATANPTGAVADLCIAQGIPAGVIGSYQQNGAALEARLVSNPNLEPETSDTMTLGFVFTPSAVPGFNLTVDYYDIKIEDAIERLSGGPGGVLNACFQSNDVNSVYCQTFTRSPTTYEIIDWGVPLANVAQLHTAGVDFAANYRWDMDNLGWGGDTARMTASLLGTWVQKNTLQPNPQAAEVDRVGTVGGDTPAIPEWRLTGSLGWASNNLSVTWRTEFISELKDRKYATAILNGAADPTAGITHPTVDAYFYHHLHAAYNFGERYQVFGGVQNLFDKEAPLLTSPIESNTDPNTYDTIGRYFYAGLSVRF